MENRGTREITNSIVVMVPLPFEIDVPGTFWGNANNTEHCENALESPHPPK